jgi:hypothetical protein
MGELSGCATIERSTEKNKLDHDLPTVPLQLTHRAFARWTAGVISYAAVRGGLHPLLDS